MNIPFIYILRRLRVRFERNNVQYIKKLYSGKRRGLHAGRNSMISPQAIIEQPERVYIGDNVQIKPGVVLRPENGFIHIGNNVVINHYTVIHAKGGVEIGDWCIIAPHCGIYAQNHSYDSFDMPITKQANKGAGITLMGDNWLGAGSIVLDGVTLGKGTVAGAGAVVTRSFPMAKVIAGNPAKVIKDRFPKDRWDFHKVERCSPHLTPEKYFTYINQRPLFASKYLETGDTVLDIGCGEGYVTSKLKDNCRKIVGIDYSVDAVQEAVKNYSLECTRMDCTNMDFTDGSFDKAVCFEVLEHLTVLQGRQTVSEIHRVLKPGGLLIGSTPVTAARSTPSTYSHIHEYTEKELKSLLEGFEDLSISGNFFVARK